MKPSEPGPMRCAITMPGIGEIVYDGYLYDNCIGGTCLETFTGRSSCGEELTIHSNEPEFHDATFTPLIPAPQWMPEGWVPTEPGDCRRYWITNEDLVTTVIVRVYSIGGNWPHGAFSDDRKFIDIGSSEFSNYRWCPMPEPPKMEGHINED